MQDFLGWLLRELILGLYWQFGAPLFDRLPPKIRFGCNVLGITIIAGFVLIVAYTLWVMASG